MAKPSEYNGQDDKDKTIPIKPRPLRRASHMLRMGYTSGDSTGKTRPDGGRAWRGEKPRGR